MSRSALEPHSIVCQDVSFAWADGTGVLTGLDTAFARGRTGLVGRNGSGKSTLLALIVGELRPASGSITVDGEVGYLPQTLTLGVKWTVADLLGIADKREALHAIESGDMSDEARTVLGDDWDIEERALAELHRFGFGSIANTVDVLDRTLGTLSGGEAMLVGLAGLLLRPPAITLLDEPTNNLDRAARERLYEAVADWPGVLLVVSHDRELLEHVNRIAELRDGTIRTFSGPFSAYLEALAAEQEAAERKVRAAEADVRRERRQLAEAQTKLARRQRYATTDRVNKRKPKIVMNQRKSEAEVSAGKHRIAQAEKVEQAREALDSARADVRDDDRIRIDLPATTVPAGRTVLEVAGTGDTLAIRGPERVALQGRNGSGKTTLLRAIVGDSAGGDLRITHGPVRLAYLPQRLDVLDDSLSIVENARAAAPDATPQEIRAGLARFLVRGDQVQTKAATLSGGERFRVSLACLLLADPPPRLLLLDEPTNNLDLASVEQLIDALAAYRGALIVASHDLPFLHEIGITRWWILGSGGFPCESSTTDPAGSTTAPPSTS